MWMKKNYDPRGVLFGGSNWERIVNWTEGRREHTRRGKCASLDCSCNMEEIAAGCASERAAVARQFITVINRRQNQSHITLYNKLAIHGFHG
jgi:hypothetical protein